jgi:hypothetical protein
MKRLKQVFPVLASIGLALSILTMVGCGSNSDNNQATKSTTNGSIPLSAAASTVPAPSGNSVTIRQNSTLTDSSNNPVTGTVATSVTYSTSAINLPTDATTLPTGATLAAFLDISIGTAKNITPALSITLNVSPAAAAGDTVEIYNFNSATNNWVIVDTLTVAADGTVSFTVRHLSIWAAFKTANPRPGKPSGVSATAGDSQVTLSWTAPDLGSPTYYNIYYATSADVTPGNPGVTQVQVANAASSAVISGLANGTTYFFVAEAVNANGKGGLSSEASAIPAATLSIPASPNGVGLAAGTGSVAVTWNTKLTATSYNIYYSASASTTSAALLQSGVKVVVPAASADPQAATQSFSVSGLTAGTTYSFIVTSLNAAGESGAQTNPKTATPL